MKEIQRNNKYFIMFDNLNEIYKELCSLLDNSKIFEEINKILLHIPLNDTKIKEIIFELNENEKKRKRKRKNRRIIFNHF